VTETDQAVEEMIKTSIAKRYPSHKLFVHLKMRAELMIVLERNQ